MCQRLSYRGMRGGSRPAITNIDIPPPPIAELPTSMSTTSRDIAAGLDDRRRPPEGPVRRRPQLGPHREPAPGVGERYERMHRQHRRRSRPRMRALQRRVTLTAVHVEQKTSDLGCVGPPALTRHYPAVGIVPTLNNVNVEVSAVRHINLVKRRLAQTARIRDLVHRDRDHYRRQPLLAQRLPAGIVTRASRRRSSDLHYPVVRAPRHPIQRRVHRTGNRSAPTRKDLPNPRRGHPQPRPVGEITPARDAAGTAAAATTAA